MCLPTPCLSLDYTQVCLFFRWGTGHKISRLLYILSLLLDKCQNLCVCVCVCGCVTADHAVAHGFMQQVFCRAQATRPPSSPSLPSPCSLAHRHQVLATCVSDLVRVGNLDDQLSDRANCAATFLQCQLLGEEVGVSLTHHVVVM